MKNLILVPRLLTTTLAVGLMTGCGGADDLPADPSSQTFDSENIEMARETERLLIADGQAPLVRVFDVAEKKVISNFPMSGQAVVYAGPSKRFAYAVQSTADQIALLDSSLVFEDHGDHQHYDKYEPILLDQPLSGDNPIHFVSHDGYVAAFFDNEGRALMMDESSLLQAERKMVSIKTSMPHHGVAIAWAGVFLVTRAERLPGSARATPVAVDVYGRDGDASGESFGPCISLHGEAARADAVAFGCDDSVLVVTAPSQELASARLMNPIRPDGVKQRVGTLAAHDRVPYFVGNFGPQFYAEIDPQAGTFISRAAPFEYSQFLFSADGSQLLFLGKKGELAVIDTSSRQLLHQSQVTSVATGMDHGARDPQMAVGKKFAYITSPASAELVVFNLSKLQESGRFTIEGEPAKLAVLDFPGRT